MNEFEDGLSFDINKELLEAMRIIAQQEIAKCNRDITKTGIIKAVNSNKTVTVNIDEQDYPNVHNYNGTDLVVNDIVKVTYPQGQTSNMYISGGGDLDDIVTTINGTVTDVISLDKRINDSDKLIQSTMDNLSKTTEVTNANVKTVNNHLNDKVSHITDLERTNLNNAYNHTSNTSNPHKVTKSQIGLDNVPNVSTNNQKPTFAQSSTLINISSGDNLSTLFSKISKAVSELITHISDTVKHITVDERNKWNDANNKKHEHSNKSIIDTITQTLINNWNNAFTHISDTVKHITSTERTRWNNMVSKSGDTMSNNLNFNKTNTGISWSMNTDGAKINFKNDGDSDVDSYLLFQTMDNDNEYFKWEHKGTKEIIEYMTLKNDGLRIKGTKVSLEGHKHIKSQITDFPTSMPASDVSAWAKAATKPTYVWNEIGSKPTTFPPSTHYHTYNNPAYGSASTGSDNNDKYFKIGTIKILQRYGFYSIDFSCITVAHGERTTSFLELGLWIKQQEDFTKNPFLDISLRKDDTAKKDFVNFYLQVEELNASYTTVGFYGKINQTHASIKLSIINFGSANASFSYVTTSFIDALPNTVLKVQSIDRDKTNAHRHTKSQITDFPASLPANGGAADTLKTARTINGTSFNGSGNIITSKWGTARNITIGNATKSIDGSANVSFSLAEIGVGGSSKSLTATATVAGWTGTAAPFTQVITVNGVSSNGNIEVGLTSSASLAQIEMASKCIIRCTAQGTNQITLKALKKKPTIDLPIQVLIIG